jgi:uncharacterized GH25 family protein
MLDNIQPRVTLGAKEKDLLMRFTPALIATFFAFPATAHELWIEPVQFQISPDSKFEAHIVNGQEFDGIRLAYIPRRFENFVVVTSEGIQSVDGRIGDTPAVQIEALPEGLAVFAYKSRVATVDYETYEDFQSFVDHKALGITRKDHDARGLTPENFFEAYWRFSKSLVAVGSGVGSDSILGLETELVALENPYTDNMDDGFDVQLMYQGKTVPDHQIEIFDRAPDGAVTIDTVNTDADGRATITVTDGHAYMLDSVILREPSAELAERTGTVWETLWANLTFAVPE